MNTLLFVILLMGVFLLVFLMFIAPKLMSWVVPIGFFGIMVAMIFYANGFSEKSFNDIAISAFASFVIWARFTKSMAHTERARAWLFVNSSTTCKICGSQLSYHRMPKNFNQLLLGGWTCPNCDNETDALLEWFKLK
jgi:hypothetical protein